ncbi:phosphoribosylglycinamide formyltransferase [Bacteroidota bacterium]
MSNIAIFASGSGTNAENIIQFFRPNTSVNINLVVSNNADAKVLDRAKKYDTPAVVINRNDLYNSDRVLNQLSSYAITHIVLAGFLWLIPSDLVKAYPNRIINIHPALLPKYGGKGMYGSRVHEAVINAGENESGITIHYVNEKYDEGNIIFQASCPVMENDSPDDLADRIHKLEYEHYPRVIEEVIEGGG